MEKKFKLPKDFATKWLEALRSGKYKQASGLLSKFLYIDTPPPTENELDNYGFCCLGVAGHVCGNPISSLNNAFLYRNNDALINIPDEIIKESDASLELFPFINVLANLNDGINKRFDLSGYIIRPDVSANISDLASYKCSFSQIADFIEDNVEFYEIEEK